MFLSAARCFGTVPARQKLQATKCAAAAAWIHARVAVRGLVYAYPLQRKCSLDNSYPVHPLCRGGCARIPGCLVWPAQINPPCRGRFTMRHPALPNLSEKWFVKSASAHTPGFPPTIRTHRVRSRPRQGSARSIKVAGPIKLAT